MSVCHPLLNSPSTAADEGNVVLCFANIIIKIIFETEYNYVSTAAYVCHVNDVVSWQQYYLAI
jgi:hypothetical protein